MELCDFMHHAYICTWLLEAVYCLKLHHCMHVHAKDAFFHMLISFGFHSAILVIVCVDQPVSLQTSLQSCRFELQSVPVKPGTQEQAKCRPGPGRS